MPDDLLAIGEIFQTVFHREAEAIKALAYGFDGSGFDRIRIDTDGHVQVDVQSGNITVQEPLSIDDNGGSLTVDASDLDIRDLDSSQDSVEVSQSTASNLNATVSQQKGDLSTDNSTETPLPLDGVFTGNWEDLDNYQGIRIAIYSDQDSAGSNHLAVEWSHDNGTTTGNNEKIGKITGDNGAVFFIPKRFRYFRVVYKTGSAQSTFVLKTYKLFSPVLPVYSETGQGAGSKLTTPGMPLLFRAGQSPNQTWSVPFQFTPMPVGIVDAGGSGDQVVALSGGDYGIADNFGLLVNARNRAFDTKNTTVANKGKKTVDQTSGGVTILALNTSRKKAWIQNVGSEWVRLDLGSSADADSEIRLPPAVGTYTIEPTGGYVYTGQITAFSESATSSEVVHYEEQATL